MTDPRHYNPALIRPGTKAQSSSDPTKKGQNLAPIWLRVRPMLISAAPLCSRGVRKLIFPLLLRSCVSKIDSCSWCDSWL